MLPHIHANRSLAQAVYANYCDMWRMVGARSPDDGSFEVVQRSDMLLITSKVVQRVPHMVLDPRPGSIAPEKWVAAMVNELGHDPVSVLVRLPPGTEQGPLAGALLGEGFQREIRPAYAMTRTLHGLPPQAPDSAISIAETPAELGEARALLSRVFGLPAPVFAFYTPPKLVATYVFRVRGAPVGAACLYGNGHSAGIYSVGVLPAMRGRGYGRRLVWQALADAAKLGLNLAVLSCERTFIPFYEQLGFGTCWELHSYWFEAWWR
jgi:GNAT superfamily N-acetyltransferase